MTAFETLMLYGSWLYVCFQVGKVLGKELGAFLIRHDNQPQRGLADDGRPDPF